MTEPRDPRQTCPPDPLEITEEEYRAAEQEHADARYEFDQLALIALMCPTIETEQTVKAAFERRKKADAEWKDAQRRAASDHQTLWRDDPAYRRKLRDREYE